ncbi:MAG: aminopeptidase [Firmicutes bacterium]|nr:aminopeptidase [Bacillota bacterium]
MSDKDLYNELSYSRKNVYEIITDDEKADMFKFCDSYREFLDKGKTERECVAETVKIIEAAGFRPLDGFETLKAGDKVYKINRGKNVFAAVIGTDDIENGMNIVGAHIDSPRLDLKQNPLYESEDMALLKTHYYGGIKKYQWTAIPLAMHGVMFTKEGKKVEINIGESENDPVFCVTDLLPHLAGEQMNKKLANGIEGENLNILFGGIPVGEDVENKVKFGVLKLLNSRYGVTESDFLNAEIEIVPAFKAKNVGIDESFIGSYGQDDRVCAYTTIRGITDIASPKRTAVALLVDKEEIGSCGNTGMLSAYFEMTVAEIVEKIKGSCSVTAYNKVIRNSACLSSDVNAALDPNYASAYEKNNASLAGYGMCVIKYTGARGKSGSSDASAEFMYEVEKIMNDNKVVWQSGELGKVDQGGGGTIAQYVANLNMDVVDCGVPVLSMHAPFEVTAKTDVYMAYKAYTAFYKDR